MKYWMIAEFWNEQPRGWPVLIVSPVLLKQSQLNNAYDVFIVQKVLNSAQQHWDVITDYFFFFSKIHLETNICCNKVFNVHNSLCSTDINLLLKLVTSVCVSVCVFVAKLLLDYYSDQRKFWWRARAVSWKGLCQFSWSSVH